MSIGLAIIGSGIFVHDRHLPAVQATPTLTLKAIYSRSFKSAEALKTGVDIYSDDSGSGKTYHDLLLRPDIHAVIIALPILSQPEYIEAALAAGKHVLSEKPIAADLKGAAKLIQYYKSDKVRGRATWGVAENFRFIDSFEFGRQEIAKLGKIYGFRCQMFTHVLPGGKYIETPWRKVPEHQGGFLLDGGIHFVAGLRYLLGETAKPTALTAYTSLLRPHLPPVDTVESCWQTKSGISGTFSISYGSTLSGREYVVACEKGSISITYGKVTVRLGEEKEGNFSETEFSEEGSGVKEEVTAWARSIADGKPDPKQSPEEALADLEIMEKMLKSGEEQGKPYNLQHQV